ncbi:MAG: hypothetical protein R3250_17680 [Melioribacteraceae bacterium]|nr:hypothetical protein [Melioribacteraceae bacterium]
MKKEKSQKEKAAKMSSESISDMLNRLSRYNKQTKSYKIDVLSIPHALQMVLRLFPHKYCNDRNLKERVLRAFVTTIIPGADQNDEFLVKMYEDSYYPFHTYCGYFVFDLNKRSKKLFGVREFNSLTLKERTAVIQNALSGRELTVRLYKGAILMAQVAYFGAVYNEDDGCKLIKFPGRNSGYEKKDITYSFAHEVFSNELSFDGHPL